MIVSHSTSRPAPPPLGYLPLANPANAPQPETRADLRAALNDIAQGLQLSRASAIALMRLQLAVRSGDRHQAMEAIDRLDTLDAQLEGVAKRLRSSDGNEAADTAWRHIGKHLEVQKLGLAFEKLALASGIVGPDLVSIENAWPDRERPARKEPAPSPADTDDSDAVREMPDLTDLWSVMDQFEPEKPRGLSPKVWGLIATILVAMAAAGAFLLLR